MDAAIPPRLIGIPEVSRITTLQRTAIYERIKAGELKPIKLGRKTVFAEAEVTAWINDQMAKARA